MVSVAREAVHVACCYVRKKDMPILALLAIVYHIPVNQITGNDHCFPWFDYLDTFERLAMIELLSGAKICRPLSLTGLKFCHAFTFLPIISRNNPSRVKSILTIDCLYLGSVAGGL